MASERPPLAPTVPRFASIRFPSSPAGAARFGNEAVRLRDAPRYRTVWDGAGIGPLRYTGRRNYPCELFARERGANEEIRRRWTETRTAHRSTGATIRRSIPPTPQSDQMPPHA